MYSDARMVGSEGFIVGVGWSKNLVELICGIRSIRIMEYHLKARERTFARGVPDLVPIDGGDRNLGERREGRWSRERRRRRRKTRYSCSTRVLKLWPSEQ